jgi:hypothetical protein
VIIKHFKEYVYRFAISTLTWYNRGKYKPGPGSILFEKMIFWARQGVVPDFKNPNKWGEFICHRKFYGDYNALTAIADKIAVRDYVEQRIGSEYLKTLIDVADNENDIDQERYLNYPDKFVAKPNHASERVFINREHDYLKFRKGIKGFLKEFGNRNNEFHYKQIKRKILIEEYLDPSVKPLKEYKVWVFNGKVEIIVPSRSVYESKLSNDYRFRLYGRKWEEPFIQVRDNPAPREEAPKQLSEIIRISEELANGWDFIRVDLFLADDQIKFGELTPTPSAGRSFFLSLEDHRYIYERFLKSADVFSFS